MLKSKVLLVVAMFIIAMLLLPVAMKGQKTSVSKTKQKTVNTFVNPDFAYPATVEKNAERELEKALKIIEKNEGENREAYIVALKSAIQITVSRNLVSADSVGAGISLMEQLAEDFSRRNGFGPVAASLAKLIEAGIYADIYKADSWTYRNRVLPDSTMSDNPKEWSAQNFSDKICGLIKEVFEKGDKATGENDIKKLPMSEIGTLLLNSTQSEEMGATVFDFMVMNSVSLLNPFCEASAGGNSRRIPFFESESTVGDTKSESELLRSKLLDNFVESCSDSDNKSMQQWAVWTKASTLPRADKSKFLYYWKDRLYTTSSCAVILDLIYKYSSDSNFNSSNKWEMDEGELYDCIQTYIGKYPQAFAVGALKNDLSELSRQKVTICMDEYNLPDKNLKGEVTLTNLDNLCLLIFKIDEKNYLNGCEYSQIAGRKPVRVVKVEAKKSYRPTKIEFSTAALPRGFYAVVPSISETTAGIRNIGKNDDVNTFIVTGISLLKMRKGTNDKDRINYVVDASTMCPVVNANVKVYGYDNKDKFIRSVVTNSDGMAECELTPGGIIKATKGSDFISDRIYGLYSNYFGDSDLGKKKCVWLTDLSVFHPGETVEFVGILMKKEEGKKLRQLNDSEIEVYLVDANFNNVDSVRLVSDGYGRVSGKFKLPKDGLLGSWRIMNKNEDGFDSSAAYFNVAEYKSPTFRVLVEGMSESYFAGDTVSLRGEVSSYSGMPMGGSKISYKISYEPLWWRITSGIGATYGGETRCGFNGKFMIKLPTTGLKGTEFEKGVFRVNISATSPSGETQETSAFFSLGNVFRISPTVPGKICMEEGRQDIKVNVLDMLGKPVIKDVAYVVKDYDTKEVLGQGVFKSPIFSFDPASYGCGKFEFNFKLDDFDKISGSHEDVIANAESETIVWSKNESNPPFVTTLWVPETEITVPEGVKEYEVAVGTSYSNGWILAVVSDDNNKILSRSWIRPSGNENGNGYMHKFKVVAPDNSQRIYITFTAMHEFETAQAMVTLIPFFQQTRLEIETESIHDRLSPGIPETWRFRFKENGKPVTDIASMAVMSNKALDAIAPFRWFLDPRGSFLYWSTPTQLSSIGQTHSFQQYMLTSYKRASADRYIIPTWNIYGFDFFMNEGRRLRIRGTGSIKKMRGVAYEVVNEMKMETAEFDSIDDMEEQREDTSIRGQVVEVVGYGTRSKIYGARDGSVDLSEEVRPVEMPLAFFKPNLVADKDGALELSFTVPDFNTTWKFQLAAYDKDMRGAVISSDVIASKPVMVAMNAPRFVRTGDKCNVAATLFNSSVENLSIGGRIVIYNPADGRIIAEREYDGETIEPSMSRTVSLEFEMDEMCDMIGIRAYAKNGSFTDAEQTVIPVLPSSSPIVESLPFYLEPGEASKVIKMPKSAKNEVVTLQYCDNPVWDCVTSLPELTTPHSDNIFSQIYSLFGNAVSSGLVRKYPEIGEALMIFSDPANSQDSTLVSNLEKNSQLKTVALVNTPWVNNAASETMRMNSLVKMTDLSHNQEVIAGIISKISSRQTPEGGWSWCEGMKPSLFVTANVLAVLSDLNRLGFMPADAKDIVRKGISYCDSEWVKAEKEAKENKYKFNYEMMADYLYFRDSFGLGEGGQFRLMAAKAIREISGSWKDYSIYGKATAASILWRADRKAEARAILESLRQFATYQPDKGMWWDNLEAGFAGRGKLFTTARVLQAWYEIQPESEEIGRIRQWIVLQKQTADWGDDRYKALVVGTLLTTGSDWTKPSAPVKILIGGREIDLSRMSKLTGNVRLQLSDKDASSEIQIIKKSVAPAWGGVISQYVAPVKDVRSVKIPQLSVEKNVLLIKETDHGTEAVKTDSYNVGDKVRVTLTLTAGQDIDYVALTDERAACMEPSQQLSGYTSTDGLWYYQETRDTATNIYIGYLPKGTYVITYDCKIDRVGDYALGIVTAQSQYSPLITAHSAGKVVKVSQ